MTKGRYGIHGGQYIPETLMNAVIELEEAYNHYKNAKEFNDELNTLLICGKTIPAVLCQKNDGRSGRCKDLFEKRRLESYRST